MGGTHAHRRQTVTHLCDKSSTMMERLNNHSIHVVWRGTSSCCCCSITATSFLILLTTITTSSIPVATETYQFPSSNVNNSLFSYSANDLNGNFSYYQKSLSTTYAYTPYLQKYAIVSCNNGSLLQAVSSQDRLYGRSTGVYSGHIYLDYTLYFQLFFVISAAEFCTKNNASTPSYYLSLWALKGYGKAQDPNKGQVVWTANVDNPVGENACLELNAGDTNLKLVDYDRNVTDRVVWQTNTSTLANLNASLTITFEGNLVLFTSTTGTNDSMLTQDILWQSYEHPTDTLMVLQALRPGYNLTAFNIDTNKTANYTLVIGPAGNVSLYAKIGYKSLYNHTSNNSTVNYTSYEYPYWVWPPHGALDTSIGDTMVLCWYPRNKSHLQLDILPSGNGLVNNEQ